MKKLLICLFALTTCGHATAIRLVAPAGTAAPIIATTTTTTIEVASATEVAVRVEIPTTTAWTAPPTPGCRPGGCRMDGDVPAYLDFPACTPEDAQLIRQGFAAGGADWDTQQFFVFVPSRESHCDNTQLYDNAATGDYSCGFFQLNARGGAPLSKAGVLGQAGFTCASVMADKQTSVDAAVLLWQTCGRGPWLRLSCDYTAPDRNTGRWFI